MLAVARGFTALALAAMLLIVGCSASPVIDEEFPPGNPVLGEESSDDPVIGDRGNDATVDGADDDTTDYALLSLLAFCLIGAGVLLVRVERWEKRRSQGAETR